MSAIPTQKAFAPVVPSSLSQVAKAFSQVEQQPKPPEDPLADDTLAIIDMFDDGAGFAPPGAKVDIPHGKQVQHVVEKSGVRAGEIRQISPSEPGQPDDLLRQPVDKYIEGMVSGTLDSSTSGIRQVLDNPGRIRVINESRGTTKARLVGALWQAREARAKVPAEQRQGRPATLAQELGLPRKASDKQVLQALTKRVDEVMAKSDTIRAAQERHAKVSQELEKRDILHVVSTGNEGNKMPLELDKLGVRYGEDFTRSVLNTDKTINVGASTGGTPDKIAPFSNGGSHVSLVMDGTGIDVGPGEEPVDGTSFSAPQVAAVVAGMRRLDPTLTNNEVRDILKRACTDTSAPAHLEGAGILNAQKALELTRERMLQSPRIIVP
jgi:plasmid stability protein